MFACLPKKFNTFYFALEMSEMVAYCIVLYCHYLYTFRIIVEGTFSTITYGNKYNSQFELWSYALR